LLQILNKLHRSRSENTHSDEFPKQLEVKARGIDGHDQKARTIIKGTSKFSNGQAQVQITWGLNKASWAWPTVSNPSCDQPSARVHLTSLPIWRHGQNVLLGRFYPEAV
jgi:hypothetical protein